MIYNEFCGFCELSLEGIHKKIMLFIIFEYDMFEFTLEVKVCSKLVVLDWWVLTNVILV